jgi:hypothetical protein
VGEEFGGLEKTGEARQNPAKRRNHWIRRAALMLDLSSGVVTGSARERDIFPCLRQ